MPEIQLDAVLNRMVTFEEIYNVLDWFEHVNALVPLNVVEVRKYVDELRGSLKGTSYHWKQVSIDAIAKPQGVSFSGKTNG